jgi:dihydropyrimidinase
VAEGADADLLLLDPTEQRTVRSVDAVSGAGFSVFDGTEVTGWPRHTIRRGEVLLRDGAVAGVAGSGAILERDRWRPPEGS